MVGDLNPARAERAEPPLDLWHCRIVVFLEQPHRSHLETDHPLLSGYREDVLRKLEGAWKVARRTIVLDAKVLLDKNLSVFL